MTMDTQFFKWFRRIGIPVLTILLQIPQYAIFDTADMARLYGEESLYLQIGKIPAIALDLLTSIFIAMVLSESSIWLSRKLDQSLPWREFAVKRLTTQFLLHLVFSVAFTMGFNVLFCIYTNSRADAFINAMIFIFGAMASMLITSSYAGIFFFQNWKHSLLQAEELKRASLQAELQALRNQLDPHFLFNSFNALTSLVEDNPKDAVKFIQELSQVYRYVLQAHDKTTATIHEELGFAKSYFYLLQARFGKNIQLDVNISPEFLRHRLPTMAMQMLIENAVKHNVVSGEYPLMISLVADDNHIHVKNNFQPKLFGIENSTQIGLRNISSRYSILTEKTVVIEKNAHDFMVSLPLLSPVETTKLVGVV
jgi:two-component system, LytTR family, sensor kinase